MHYYTSGVIVKKVREASEEADDIQISSAATVFRDALHRNVDSIVLVSMGNLVCE